MKKRINELTPEQQEAKRKYNREAKRRQRATEHEATSEHETQRIRQVEEEELKLRQKLGRCFLGEVSPGVDAATITDALQVAREMARAIGISDVQPGESLVDFERRTFEAWARYDKFNGRSDCAHTGGGAPFLNRNSHTLSPGWGHDYWLNYCGGFDRCWKALPGAKHPIDVSGLPRLPDIPRDTSADMPKTQV